MPAAHGNGRAMRAGVFLEGMARSHDVTVVVVPSIAGSSAEYCDEAAFVRQLASSCLVLDPADAAEAARWPSVLLSTPAGRRRARELYPLPVEGRTPSQRSVETLRELISNASLVHVMRSYLAPCLDFLFDDDNPPPVTLDLDELDSDVERQLGDPREAARLERLERYYLPLFDHVYAASNEDARKVRARYGISVTAVANAARPPLTTSAVERRFDLLFVGNLSYQPNIDAARWLCEEIRPVLGAKTIAIVGSDPPTEVRSFARLQGVTVAANVAEVDSWYAASSIAVVPIRVGGGTRIKILEALAHERPVVATSRGAEGLPVGEGNGIVLADTAGDFAAACGRLLEDAATAQRIAAAGKARVTMVDEVLDQIDSLTIAAVNGRHMPSR